MQDWDDLRFVLAVARQRSFAGAAKLLGVNESTVARRIAKAEAGLQTTLFERSDGRLHPTEAGAELVRRAEKIELEVQAGEEAIAGTDVAVAGTVRITSVPLIVNRVLAPNLPSLLDQHPNLQVELIAEPADLSVMGREADIALRLARPQKEMRALARRIGDVRYGVFGSRQETPKDGPWITYTDAMLFLPQSRWIAEQAAKKGAELSAVRVSDAETLLQAIKAGLGKSFLPLFLAETEPELVRIDNGASAWSRELWMMVHPELKDLARIRTTADWLAGVMRDRLRAADASDPAPA